MALPVRTREASDTRPMGRWQPFRELESLHSQMGELMDTVWAPLGVGNGVWVPIVDIEEAEDAWLVEGELPGVDRKDVNVELRDSELSITGEIKERERKGILRRRTRRAGRFDFRVTLPGEVDADHIDAKLRDGVLTVRVPKAEQARPHRIEVTAEQQ
ncbi:MAG TPA: Hsp20/alpha crystallin family protein [Solirubrobacteraceae bacterium]|nr:Hsp20/alpha crystallin family protein [Solirubrobacteraceae bacterium]